MTLLDDIAAARARLQKAEAAVRASPSPTGERRRLAAEQALLAARGKLAVDPSAAFPLLLLPVRLETRFAWQDPADATRQTFVRPAQPMATPVLLVRIYPDDIHVDAHEPGLTPREMGWRVDFLKRAAKGSDRSDFVAAWEQLVARVGATRAAWIVSTRPPAIPVRAGQVAQPARATVLPDRFVAQVEFAGNRTITTGNLVAEPLDVTPDPLGSADRLRWMTNFDTAVKAGLGLVVPLPPTDGRPPTIDRLMVVGTDASRDAIASARALEALLDAHHYTDGLAFSRPGAATNAVAGERPDRTSRPAIDDVFTVEGDMVPLNRPATLLDHPPADGLEAASLLGIDARKFAHTAGADGRLRQAARDVRRLMTGAWLDPLAHLVDPTIARADLEAAADYFAESVDCLGPLPVLRVGSQPYGILPVSVMDPGQGDLPDVERRVLTALLVLRRTVWEPALARVPRIGGPPADPTATLLALLRQDGITTDASVRPVLGPEATAAFASTIDFRQLRGWLRQRAGVRTFLDTLAGAGGLPNAVDLLFTDGVPVTLPLVGPDPTGDLDPFCLRVPLSTTLLDLSLGAPGDPPTVLAAIARLALLSTAAHVGGQLLLGAGVVDAATVAGWERERDDGTTPLYELAARLNTALPGDPLSPIHALLTSAAPPAGSEPFLAAREAIRSVATFAEPATGRPARERADLLDTVLRSELGGLGHRLDAWFTALATSRLRRLRGTAGRETGFVLGAFGVLLDIVPNEPGSAVAAADLPPGQAGEVFRTASNGGHVHAPSVAHAVTAAVLRSTHLGHWRLAGGTGTDAFSVDLSSRRVRVALGLLDGIREGQPLGALLGYRLERSLRAKAPAAIAVVRRAAPLAAGRLTPGGPAERVAADNVVDALALMDLIGEPTPAAALAALAAYRGGLSDPDLDAAAAAVAEAVADARDALDAVSDLVMAEGVFGLVQGNPVRSAGAVDAIAAAGTPPPSPGVTESVRGGTAVVHRAMVVLPAEATPADDPGGWAITPRVALEPALELWARSVLPAAPTLAPLRLGALDVVAASAPQLEARLEIAGLTPDGLDDLVEAAAAMRELLTACRPLRPADLVTVGASPLAGADPAAATARTDAFAAAVRQARDGLVAAIGAATDGAALRAALLAADLVGTSLPVPASLEIPELLAAANVARDQIAGRLAAEAPGAAPEERVQALAGVGAWVLPALVPVASWPGQVPDGATPEEVERHVMRAATVRPAVARLDRVLGVEEALTATNPSVTVSQTPLEAGERWAAVGGGPVLGGRLSSVIHAPLPLTGDVAGLFVDEWTDVVPDARATTSLAFHYDAPASAAPNVALLGVAPVGVETWSVPRVLEIVAEGLSVAALRAVDPDALTGSGPLLPLLFSRENPTPGVTAGLDAVALTEPR